MTPPPLPRSPATDRRRSLWALVVLAVPLGLGACLGVDAERATFLGQSGPPCVIAQTVGAAACPGCGLTRSTAMVVQGRGLEATAIHPAGWLVVLLCLAGCTVHADVLRHGTRTWTHERMLFWGRRTFVLGLTVCWALRVAWQ